MAESPTQRSLKLLRADTRFTLVAVTEHWNPHARIRQDLFGIIDLIAIGPGLTVAVQTTSYGGMSARIKKLREHPSTPFVLAAGWQLHVHGWRKTGRQWSVVTRRFEFSSTEHDRSPA